MLTISCAINYLLNNQQAGTNNEQENHPFKMSKYRQGNFPQSAQFLDYQWTPEGVPGQFKNMMTGLKPLDRDCLIHVDTKCFVEEIKLRKALLDKSRKYRDLVTAGLDWRLDAQKELLDLVIDNLKSYHQEHFQVTKQDIKVNITGEIFRFKIFFLKKV